MFREDTDQRSTVEELSADLATFNESLPVMYRAADGALYNTVSAEVEAFDGQPAVVFELRKLV